MFLLASTVGVLLLRQVQVLVSPWIPSGSRELSFVTVLAGGLVIGHLWTFHLVDPRRWAYVALGLSAWRPAWIAMCAGLGALAIAVPVALLLATGWLRFEPGEPGSSLGAALAAVAVLIPASAWEELFVRGYAYSAIRERLGPGAAISLTSSLFGLMHFVNAGASVRAVSVVVVAGVFLGLIREATRSLYAAWAAHLAWNVVLVVVLHATVSGVTMPAPDYRLVDAGPDWATGGTWGPEGGLFALGGIVAATCYVYWRATRRREPDE